MSSSHSTNVSECGVVSSTHHFTLTMFDKVANRGYYELLSAEVGRQKCCLNTTDIIRENYKKFENYKSCGTYFPSNLQEAFEKLRTEDILIVYVDEMEEYQSPAKEGVVMEPEDDMNYSGFGHSFCLFRDNGKDYIIQSYSHSYSTRIDEVNREEFLRDLKRFLELAENPERGGEAADIFEKYFFEYGSIGTKNYLLRLEY